MLIKAFDMDRVKRIWYLSPMHTSIESRGTFRQKTRSLALLNCWACAVKICHDGMLEDTNSLDGAHIINTVVIFLQTILYSFVSYHIVGSHYAKDSLMSGTSLQISSYTPFAFIILLMTLLVVIIVWIKSLWFLQN